MPRTHWMQDAGVDENVAALGPVLVRKYLRAGEKTVARKRTPAEMHEFRLKTKEFRYTLESLEPAAPQFAEPWLELLKPVQKVLGELNDCAATLELLGDRASRELRKYLKRRARKQQQKFRKVWSELMAAAKS